MFYRFPAAGACIDSSKEGSSISTTSFNSLRHICTRHKACAINVQLIKPFDCNKLIAHLLQLELHFLQLAAHLVSVLLQYVVGLQLLLVRILRLLVVHAQLQQFLVSLLKLGTC
jgi:hypothetical protein